MIAAWIVPAFGTPAMTGADSALWLRVVLAALVAGLLTYGAGWLVLAIRRAIRTAHQYRPYNDRAYRND